MAGWRNVFRQSLQPGEVQPGIYESRSKVPGSSEAMAFEPFADGFRAVAASKVVELERLAEPAEKGLHFVGGLLQVRGRPTRRGGWIVQFVGQTRSHCAERSELFPLLRVAFQVPHPVCSRAKNLTRDCLAGDKHPPKALFTKPEQASRLGHTERRNPRDVQQQHRLAEIASRFVNAQKDGL